MANAALDSFGRILMTRVRDKAIFEWKGILSGHMKGETAEAARSLLSSVEPECTTVLGSLLPQIVDSVLHHLLWTVEQSDEVRVAVRAGDETVDSLKDVSDGLSGELYGHRGWIARFSQHKEGA